jgi:endonuclease/exonuclease/phosphatase family metal-dependent hydrolase
VAASPEEEEVEVHWMSHHRRALAVAIAALVALVFAPSAIAAKRGPVKRDLTVMSRNLYLGADIIKLATAPDLATEQANAKALHDTVVATNFPVRAKELADEIRRTKPDVIGLQEVARYFRGPDGVHDGIRNATTPLFDWLDILRKEMSARGLNYRVVSRQDELDVEVPSDDNYDIRLILGNAVLVKAGPKARVKVVSDRSGTFTNQLTVPLPDQQVALKRGYAGFVGRVGGKRFLFLDPHAEAYSGDIAGGQIQEMLGTVASNRKLPTILAGDFNSDPAQAGADAKAYNAAIDAGFVNTGKRVGTCCQDERLDNAQSKLTQWIDHILVRPKMRVVRSEVLGEAAGDKVGGLWPSDHAGLVVTLRLR